MATKLKLSFRKRRGVLHVQIVEQSPKKLKYTTMGGYEFRCVVCPEVDDNVFHLRGKHADRDRDWTDFPNDVPSLQLVTALWHFATENGLGIRHILVSSTEVQIVIDDDPTIDYPIPTVDARLQGLGDSPDSAFKDEVKCGLCIKVSDDIKYVDTGEQNMLMCGKCMSKYSKCDLCSNLRDKLTEHTDSLGKKKNVCAYCKPTMTCDKCGFKELKLEQILFYFIDNNGETQSTKLCKKCGQNNKNCGFCGNYYVPEYPDCPCRIPKDFKGMLQPYNADVTQHLPLDEDCTMGMELEVGVHLKHRPYWLQIYNQTHELTNQDAITVYDSSIDYLDGSAKTKPNTYRGFEIVTRPMNERNMIKFIYKLTENKHKLLKSWYVETCGIHIHYSRKHLTKIEIGKLLKFINEPGNNRLIKFVARRYNPKYAPLSPKKITDCKIKPKDHYHALNLSKNPTIEFRIFKGSLKRDTLLSYVQFVKSSIAFVRNTSACDLTAERYLEWIQTTQRSLYRELKDYLKTLTPKGKLILIGGDE